MTQKKETSSRLAGRELAENKGILKTFCQGQNINHACSSCKIISAIIHRGTVNFAAYPVVFSFDPSRKLLPAPRTVKEKLQILQHSLGVDQYGRGEQYRNHFATGSGGSDWDICQELAGLGLMKRYEPKAWMGGMYCFVVTEEGKAFVAENSPAPPKLTRSQKRYRRYLEYGEGFDSFRDFLIWDSEPERSWNGGREERCYA